MSPNVQFLAFGFPPSYPPLGVNQNQTGKTQQSVISWQPLGVSRIKGGREVI